MQAFREAYLFTELKELLQQWSPMLDSVLDPDSLPAEAALDAQAAAAAAFDISPLGLRFRVPSAGFLLIWMTAPESPARRSCMRRIPSDGAAAAARKRHPASQRPTRSDDVLVQVGRPPIDSRRSFKSARVASGELAEGTPPPASKVGDMGPPPDVHGAKRMNAAPATASR